MAPTLWSVYMSASAAITRESKSGVRLSPAPYDGLLLEKTIEAGPRQGQQIRMILRREDCEWLRTQLDEIFSNARPDLVEPAP